MASNISIAQSLLIISIMPHESASSERLPMDSLQSQKLISLSPILGHVIYGKESPR